MAEQVAAGEMMLIFGWSATVGDWSVPDVAVLGRPDRDHSLGLLRI
jgi:hypothetical protein